MQMAAVSGKSSRIFQTLKAHKKKSVLFTICIGFAAKWAQKRKIDMEILSQYCEEARKFGEERIVSLEKPRRVTVLLNSFAKEGKARAAFEKNVMPLFHLAGLEVTVLKPSDAGQLQAMAGALDKDEADAIYIVGGDGTLSRVLTGICFPDSGISNTKKKAGAKKGNSVQLPLGVFPGGRQNYCLRRILTEKRLKSSTGGQDSPQNECETDKSRLCTPPKNVQWYCESAMALIRDAKEKVNVLEVKVGDEEKRAALSHVHSGAFQWVDMRNFHYWYWGKWRGKFAYVWSSLKGRPVSFCCQMEFVAPCEGCKNCYQRKKVNNEEQNGSSWYWMFLDLLFGRKPQESSGMQKDYRQVENKSCGQVNVMPMKITNEVLAENWNLLEENSQIRLRTGPEVMNRRQFIWCGWRREDAGSSLEQQDLNKNRDEVSDFYKVDFLAEKVGMVLCGEEATKSDSFDENVNQTGEETISLKDIQMYSSDREDLPLEPYSEVEKRKVSVDGEIYEVENKRIDIGILPRKVTMFVPNNLNFLNFK